MEYDNNNAIEVEDSIESEEYEADTEYGQLSDVVTDGIKSKSRVKEHGEVYTPNSTVCDMMDLLKEEGYRVESKILEPSCGNGNFLVEILKRKMQEVNSRYVAEGSVVDAYNLNLAKAVSCIYGIDIMPDNIVEAKSRLRSGTPNDPDHPGYIAQYKADTGEDIPEWLDKTLVYLMDHNIQLGNTLTNEKYRALGKIGKPDGNLLVSEWNFNGTKVTRVDYYMFNIDVIANDEYRTLDYSKLFRLKDLGEKEVDI